MWTAKELIGMGYSRRRINSLVKEGKLHRVLRGVYALDPPSGRLCGRRFAWSGRVLCWMGSRRWRFIRGVVVVACAGEGEYVECVEGVAECGGAEVSEDGWDCSSGV